MGIALFAVRHFTRAMRGGGSVSSLWSGGDEDGSDVAPDRAYLYKLQLALGRSARGVQDRLADFAAKGDTTTEAGLASLLQQTALELLREKDSVRYVGADGRRPISLPNAETAIDGTAPCERPPSQG